MLKACCGLISRTASHNSPNRPNRRQTKYAILSSGLVSIVVTTLFLYFLLDIVCKTTSKGIYSWLSIADRPIETFVQLQTGRTFGLPYVTSGRALNWTALGQDGVMSLQIRPLFDRAMLAVMRYYKWRYIYYIYDGDDGQSVSQTFSIRILLLSVLLADRNRCPKFFVTVSVLSLNEGSS